MRTTLKLIVAATRLPVLRGRRQSSGRLFTLLVASVLAIASLPGHAGTYPERIIKVVVPFPAGGPTDVAARLVAQALSSRLGQTVIVENLAGAGGRLGAKAVAGASPDGYTLLLGGTNVNAIMGAVYKDLPFDPIASFAPIAPICVDSMALAVSPRVPAESFVQFVQYAKNNPGKLTYGAPPAIYTQFAAEFFKVRTGTDILFVPYKGAAPAITDLLGGQVAVMFADAPVLMPHIQAGKLKAIGVASGARNPVLPDVPTMREQGYADTVADNWCGLLAPAKTPPAIIAKLSQAVRTALNDPVLRDKLVKSGATPVASSPEEFAKFLKDELERLGKVIREHGIKEG